MPTHSGYIGMHTVGSTLPGSMEYQTGKKFPFENGAIENITAKGCRGNYLEYAPTLFPDQDKGQFEIGFFDLHQSGYIINSVNSGASGVFLPDRENNILWEAAAKDETNELLYESRFSTPSGSGYIDLDTSFNVVDDFTVLLSVKDKQFPSSGCIFYRGTEASDGLEFLVTRMYDGVSAPEDNTVTLIWKDATDAEHTLELDKIATNHTTSTGAADILISYKGDALSGEFYAYHWNTTEVFNQGKAIRSGWGWPRKKVSGAKTLILKDGRGELNNYNGGVEDFGAGSGIMTTQSDWLSYGKRFSNYAPYVEASGDNLYLTTFVPDSIYSSAVELAPRYIELLSEDTQTDYQFLYPIQMTNPLDISQQVLVAPSSVYVDVTHEHNTSHSGGIEFSLGWTMYAGASVYRKWNSQHITLPSGNKQTTRFYGEIPPDTAPYESLNESTIEDNFTRTTLQLYGDYDTNSGNSYYGELKIHHIDVQADMWCVAVTGVADTDLYTAGTLPKGRGDIDLFLFNNYEPGDVDLFIEGHQPTNDNMPLYTQAGLQNKSINLSIPGIDTHSGDMTLWIGAGVYNSGDTTLFIEGIFRENKNIPLFITTPLPTTGSGDMPLYTWGTTNPAMFDSVPLVAYNSKDADPDNVMNLYLSNTGGVQNSGSMNLVIGADPADISDDIPLFVAGPQGSNFSLNMFMSSPSGTDGAVPTTSMPLNETSMNLFINRENNSTANRMPLFIGSPEPVNKSFDMFVEGAFKSNNNTTMYVSGSPENPNGSMEFYTHGF